MSPTQAPSTPDQERAYEVILVGGGLVNGLIALVMLHERPALRLALVERASRLGGKHTWCFHDGDLPAEFPSSIAERLPRWCWSDHEVRFPGFERRLNAPYAGLDDAHLADLLEQAVAEAPHAELILDTEVTEVGPRRVEGRHVDGGTVVLTGDRVVDARGPRAELDPAVAGFQKFVGRRFRTLKPHGVRSPILMDARVDQTEGYRFFYVLPFSEYELLVEDTRFHDRPELDEDRLLAEIDAYLPRLGIDPACCEVVDDERGILPMPWRMAAPDAAMAPLRAGYAGNWFHPATGYSFPLAARHALLVARASDDARLARDLAARARVVRRRQRFACLLNDFLFRWIRAEDRWHVMARFYGLSDALIRRFYALEFSWLDALRLVVGRPPRGFSIRTRLFGSRRTEAMPRDPAHVGTHS